MKKKGALVEQTNVSGGANEEDCLGTAASKASFL